MSRAATTVGVVAAAGTLAAFGALLRANEPARELSVELASPRHYVVDESTDRWARGAAIGPPELRERLERREWGRDKGIHLSTWRIEYGHRWEREVTVPTVTGPFVKPSSAICDAEVDLGAALFDSKREGRALAEVLEDLILKEKPFPSTHADPEHGLVVNFPAIRSVAVSSELVEGSVSLSITFVLTDLTVIKSSFKIGLYKDWMGLPTVRRIGDVSVLWSGPTLVDLQRQASEIGMEQGGLMGLAGCIFGPWGCAIGVIGGAGAGDSMAREKVAEEAPRQIASEIRKKLDERLAALPFQSLARDWTLPGAKDASLRVRLDSDPIVSTGGIRLPLCVSLETRNAIVDPAVSGPITVVSQSQPGGLIDSGPTISARIGVNTLNLLSYAYWQTGAMGRLGGSKMLLTRIPERIRSLNIEVDAITPELPPVIYPGRTADTLDVVIGSLRVGRTEPGDLLVHGTGTIAVTKNTLSVRVDEVAADCARGNRRSSVIVPCLSDVTPQVRESIREKSFAVELPVGGVLGSVPGANSLGLNVTVQTLEISTQSGPAHVRGKATVGLAFVPDSGR